MPVLDSVRSYWLTFEFIDCPSHLLTGNINMVTLYERRSLSLMALSEWGRGSPLLPPSSPISIPTNSNGPSGHGCNHIMNESLNNNTSVTSITSGDNSLYNLEVSVCVKLKCSVLSCLVNYFLLICCVSVWGCLHLAAKIQFLVQLAVCSL